MALMFCKQLDARREADWATSISGKLAGLDFLVAPSLMCLLEAVATDIKASLVAESSKEKQLGEVTSAHLFLIEVRLSESRDWYKGILDSSRIILTRLLGTLGAA